eukprot:264677-Prymnesium_polylepis.1
MGTISGAWRMSASVYVRNLRSAVFEFARRAAFIAAGFRSVSPLRACSVITSAMLTSSPST